jgi:hypothetical protein
MSIQTDGTMLDHSMEEILRDVNNTGSLMVRFARKLIDDRLYGLTPIMSSKMSR